MTLFKKITFFVTLLVSFVGFWISAYAVVNTEVSLKHETKDTADCISLITGRDLCLESNIFQSLVVLCIAVIVLLIVFRKWFFKTA